MIILEPPPVSVFVKSAWTDWEVIGCLVCLPLTTFPFVIRCYVKLKLNQRPFIEDWCCFLSWALAVLDIAITFRTINYGLTQPASALSPDEHKTLRKWIYALSLISGPAILFTKLTLLAIMARLFSTHIAFALSIRLVIAVTVLFFGVVEIVKAALCRPARKLWDPQGRDRGYCINWNKIFVADTLFVIIIDFAILIISVVSTIPLRVSFFRKLKVIGLLGAGSMAVGITIYRERLVVEYAATTNYTQDLAKIIFYCRLEVTIGQLCACLPFASFLLQRKSKKSMMRQTKRTRPTAHVWFGSIRTLDHPIMALNSTLTHAYPPKPPPDGCPVLAGSPKGECTDAQLPFPSRVARTASEHVREEPGPAFLPPVDDWYLHDVEQGRVGLDLAEPSQPSGTAGMLPRAPEILAVLDRIVSCLPPPSRPRYTRESSSKSCVSNFTQLVFSRPRA